MTSRWWLIVAIISLIILVVIIVIILAGMTYQSSRSKMTSSRNSSNRNRSTCKRSRSQSPRKPKKNKRSRSQSPRKPKKSLTKKSKRSRSQSPREPKKSLTKKSKRSRSYSPSKRLLPCKKLHEKECRRVLELRYGIPFPTIRPKWLPSPHSNHYLEIDCYNYQLKLGVEYDGIQHREPGHFGMTLREFRLLQERDRYKDKLCRQLGIHLIRVPDTVPFKRIEDYLTIRLDQFDKQRSTKWCTIC